MVARCFFGNVSCLTSSARTGKYPVEVELDFFGVLIMDDVIRFDAITLASRDRADEFETFVKGTLFPVMMSAYGGHLTRKTLASLVGQVLLKEGAGERGYAWVSAWSGPLEAVKDKNFRGVFMGENEDAEAALCKLDEFGHRERPRLYQHLAGTLSLS